MEKEKAVRAKLQKNPLVLLHVPSPPHGTIGPFRPRVQDDTTALQSFLPTYLFRLSYELNLTYAPSNPSLL